MCPLINASWDSNIHALNVYISYEFNSSKDELPGFFDSLPSTQPFDRDSLFITSQELWSAFGPRKLRERHPALQKIHIVLDIQGGGYDMSTSGQDKVYMERRLAQEIFHSIMYEPYEVQAETMADDLIGMCEVDVQLLA